MAQLLGTPLLAAESQQSLLERAGGNPLYAEQFAELYLERGSADELPLPETLQGIIAARLDGLSARREGAAPGCGRRRQGLLDERARPRRPGEAGTTLHALERKGFVRRQRRSSVEGESELAFAHALVRDVAYGQIARADRAAKHQRVGRVDRGSRATRGSRRAGRVPLALRARPRARLGRRRRAGCRTNTARAPRRGRPGVRAQQLLGAAAQYEDALALWPQETADRPVLLFSLGASPPQRLRRAPRGRSRAGARRLARCRGDRFRRRGGGFFGACMLVSRRRRGAHALTLLGRKSSRAIRSHHRQRECSPSLPGRARSPRRPRMQDGSPRPHSRWPRRWGSRSFARTRWRRSA